MIQLNRGRFALKIHLNIEMQSWVECNYLSTAIFKWAPLKRHTKPTELTNGIAHWIKWGEYERNSHAFFFRLLLSISRLNRFNALNGINDAEHLSQSKLDL